MGLYHSIYLLNAFHTHSLRTGDQKSSLGNSALILFKLNQIYFVNTFYLKGILLKYFNLKLFFYLNAQNAAVSTEWSMKFMLGVEFVWSWLLEEKKSNPDFQFSKDVAH